MAIHKHLPEETIIDLALGKLDDEKRNQALLHITSCPQCKEQLDNWLQILNVDSSPSINDSLKERIWHSYETKRKNRFNYKPKFGLALACVAVVLLFLSIHILSNTREDPMEMAHYKAVQTEKFRNKPDTKKFNIVPVYDSEINGNLWVNHVTNEMLLEVDGLTELMNEDYQLWIIYSDDKIEGILIPTRNGKTELFFENMNVTQFKRVKASIEPKGGSILPTGPETFFVEFQKLYFPK